MQWPSEKHCWKCMQAPCWLLVIALLLNPQHEQQPRRPVFNVREEKISEGENQQPTGYCGRACAARLSETRRAFKERRTHTKKNSN